MNGSFFSDLDKFEKYKRQFWRYRIPIIFIETEDEDLVRNVFDRLNRNGEPLVPQELRHAKYGETKFYKDIQELTEIFCWKNIFSDILEVERMENHEFISELMFVVINKKIGEYTKATLDNLYEQCKNDFSDDIKLEIMSISDYIGEMGLDYNKLKIKKVGHLYAIWVIAYLAKQQSIAVDEIGSILNSFYENYLTNKNFNEYTKDYKASMSAGTKGRSSRMKRVNALIGYCKERGIEINNML